MFSQFETRNGNYFSPRFGMDSAEDASRQVNSSRDLFRDSNDFCERPFCLGKAWHAWGCCSTNTISEPPTKDSVQDNQPFGWSLDDEDPPAFMSELIRLSEDRVRMRKPEEPKLAQSRYAIPRSDEEVNKARTESVPKTTKTDTTYCVKLWNDWAENRHILTDVLVPPLAELDSQSLQYWLSRFVWKSGRRKEWSTNQTLYTIWSVELRHIRHNCGKPEIDFFKDPSFADFRSSLDAEMKRLQAAGVGSV